MTKAGVGTKGSNALGRASSRLWWECILKLALLEVKTGPVIGIVPITGLSFWKEIKISGNKKGSMIPQKDLEKTTGYIHGADNPVGIRQKRNFPIILMKVLLNW